MASLKKHEKYIQNYYNKITKFLYIKTFTISKLLQNYY